jgi:hypothetical protein
MLLMMGMWMWLRTMERWRKRWWRRGEGRWEGEVGLRKERRELGWMRKEKMRKVMERQL